MVILRPVRIPMHRCLSYMKNLHADVQCQALTEYANRRSKDSLNNPPAYFMSLLQVTSALSKMPAVLFVSP